MYASPSVATNQGYLAVAAALVALAVGGAWFWNRHLSQQELLALPSQQRHALYVHTLETLETVCMRTQGRDLTEYCREQARFIVRLPECGATCQEICRRLAPKPTK